MLRVFLGAVLVTAGVVAFGVALTVDCGPRGITPPWLDVLVGAIQFGGAAFVLAGLVSSRPRLPPSAGLATLLVTMCVGFVLISFESLGACAN